MRILPFILVVSCVAWQTLAAAQEEEPRPAPPRGLLSKRGLLAKGKTTTTTTPAPQQEEVEYEDDAEYVAEGEPAEPSTEAAPSSTEGKKLVGSGVRPFRSNTDLLEALKRRRAQAAEAKLHGHVSTAAPAPEEPTEAPVKANISKKRFNSGASSADDKPGRKRFGRPSPKAVEPEPEVEEEVTPAPARTGRQFRRGGSN